MNVRSVHLFSENVSLPLYITDRSTAEVLFGGFLRGYKPNYEWLMSVHSIRVFRMVFEWKSLKLNVFHIFYTYRKYHV